MIKIKKTNKTKYWQGCGATEFSITAAECVDLYNHLVVFTNTEYPHTLCSNNSTSGFIPYRQVYTCTPKGTCMNVHGCTLRDS